MDDIFRGVDKSYPLWFIAQLQELHSEGYLVDVTLCAEGREFPCHRLVLSAYSDYFHAMFSGNHIESTQDKVEIGGVSAEALQILVDFAYTSKMTITMDNVQSLFQAANMLQVIQMKEACELFLNDRLCVDSCLMTWLIAEVFSSTALHAMAKGFALKNFEEVCMTRDFLHLDVGHLKLYLSDSGLHARKEKKVLEAIMEWTRHNLKERQRHLRQLLECVRFSNVDPNYLQTTLKNDKVFAGVRGIKTLIENQSARARPRQILQEEILVLGGITGEYEVVNKAVYRLDLHGNCVSRKLLPQPLRNGEGLAACILDNDVIVTGGQKSRCQAWRYESPLNKWSKLGPLNTGRNYHGMAILHGQVYVVGGTENDDIDHNKVDGVEAYSEMTNSWNERAALKKAVSNFGIASCCDKLYISGGEEDELKDCDEVQYYNPTQNVWSYASALPEAMTGIRACTVNSQIYLVGGRLPYVIRYKPQEDLYERLVARLDSWERSSATVCGSEIYITGGCKCLEAEYSENYWKHRYEDKLPGAVFQCYNTSSNVIIRGKDLPITLREHCSVTVSRS